MARYMIDANLPRRFSLWASDDYVFVADLGPDWTDGEIWDYALRHTLTIVTKDADFADRVLLAEASPCVIHVRLGNMRMREFHGHLSAVWDEICRLSATCRLVQIYHDRIETVT